MIARPTRSARFALAPGDHAYHFHVEPGAGGLTIHLRRSGEPIAFAGDGFDTAFGFHGRVFHCTVSP